MDETTSHMRVRFSTIPIGQFDVFIPSRTAFRMSPSLAQRLGQKDKVAPGGRILGCVDEPN